MVLPVVVIAGDFDTGRVNVSTVVELCCVNVAPVTTPVGVGLTLLLNRLYHFTPVADVPIAAFVPIICGDVLKPTAALQPYPHASAHKTAQPSELSGGGASA